MSRSRCKTLVLALAALLLAGGVSACAPVAAKLTTPPAVQVSPTDVPPTAVPLPTEEPTVVDLPLPNDTPATGEAPLPDDTSAARPSS